MNVRPPLRLLQVFHCVVQEGSFTGAAAALGITQPAVSQQIRELETVIGVELFRRTGRGVQPTTAGEHLEQGTGKHVEAIERGVATIGARTQPHHVEIRVNATFATAWLLPRLPSFLSKNPVIELDLTSSYWAHTADPVHTAVHIDFGPPPTQAEPIGGQETVVAVARPDIARQIRTIPDLANHPLLDIRGGDGWNEFLTAIGATTPQTRTHTSMTYLHTLALASSGLGVALAHSFIITDALHDGDLAIVELGTVTAREQYYLITPRPDRATPAAQQFIDWLRAEL